MKEHVKLRIEELEREIKNELRGAITETIIVMMQWRDGDLPECKTIDDVRQKIYKQFYL